MFDKEKIFNDFESQRLNAGLTFADVDKIFEKNNFDYQGNIKLTDDLNDNVVYWSDWNKEAYDLFQEYMFKYDLRIFPTSVLAYLSSGKGLDLPIFKPIGPDGNWNWFDVYDFE